MGHPAAFVCGTLCDDFLNRKQVVGADGNMYAWTPGSQPTVCSSGDGGLGNGADYNCPAGPWTLVQIPGGVSTGSGYPAFAANNGPQQQIGPAPQPPDTHTHKYSDYLACAFGTEINDMFGDKNKAATTVLINIAPLAPANYLKGGPIPYLIVAGVWDIGHALKARNECTASVYGR